jgi:hypothetical protein
LTQAKFRKISTEEYTKAERERARRQRTYGPDLEEAAHKLADKIGLPSKKESLNALRNLLQGKSEKMRFGPVHYLRAWARFALAQMFYLESYRVKDEATRRDVLEDLKSRIPQLNAWLIRIQQDYDWPLKDIRRGRKRKLSPEKERQLINLVHSLTKTGHALRWAIETAAKEHQVNKRTAYRICQKFGVR